MNLTLFGAVALMVFVGDSCCGFGPNFGGFAAMGGGPFGMNGMAGGPNGMIGGPNGMVGGPLGPSAGWMMSQEAQKNAANAVVDNAIFKAGSTDLPPELQVIYHRHTDSMGKVKIRVKI